MSDVIRKEIEDRIKVAEANVKLRHEGIAEAEARQKRLLAQLVDDEAILGHYREQLQAHQRQAATRLPPPLKPPHA